MPGTHWELSCSEELGKMATEIFWGKRNTWGKKKTFYKEQVKFALCPESATCSNTQRFNQVPSHHMGTDLTHSHSCFPKAGFNPFTLFLFLLLMTTNCVYNVLKLSSRFFFWGKLALKCGFYLKPCLTRFSPKHYSVATL